LSKELAKLREKLKPLNDKILQQEEDINFLKHENSTVKNEREQLKVALKISYANCDKLLTISKQS